MKLKAKSTIPYLLRRIALASLTAALGVVAVGCHGGGGVVVAPAWYNVYGGYCGSGTPTPGCNFYADGYKIRDTEDPYYGSNFYTYDVWNYYDSYGYYSTYVGYAWQSPDGIIYRMSDGAALNEDGSSESRDLVSAVAKAEKLTVEKVGKSFAQRYALSEETGLHIAKTLNDYATLTIKQKRSRTDKDFNDFSKRLFGINPDHAKAAIDQAKKGNTEALIELNDQIAANWGTNPETSKQILKSWSQNQLSDVNIK